MKDLHHVNIIRLHTYYVEKRSLFMAMEYASGGDLSDLIEKCAVECAGRGRGCNEAEDSKSMQAQASRIRGPQREHARTLQQDRHRAGDWGFVDPDIRGRTAVLVVRELEGGGSACRWQ